MGQSGENCKGCNMLQQVVCASLVLLALGQAAPQTKHNLPVLFQFSHPTHNVAVFRGAALKQAIAAGVVKGFGNLGAGGDQEERGGRADDGGDYSPPTTEAYVAPTTTTTTTTPPPPPPTTEAYVAPTTVAPVYKPAPVVYRPAPVVYRPAPVVYKPAPVVYKPAPVPKPAPSYAPAVAYKPYVDQYADTPAVYNWEYAVKDDYSNNDFGAKENRDGYLTNGVYYVSLPDGRLQTVTYTVDGGNGYVPVVEYAGEAQYPPEKSSYSA